MSETSSSTSGVFIQPRWKRAPSTAERILALLMTIMPIMGLIAATLLAGFMPPRVKEAARKVERSVKSLRPPLAAEQSEGALAAQAAPGRYARGREWMANASVRPVQALMSLPQRGGTFAWLIAAGAGVLGLLFCFLGWQVRRVTAALYGALLFGLVALVLGLAAGMGVAASLVVALPPAFLGALVGWHLIVINVCVQVGWMVFWPTLLVFALNSGDGGMPAWTLPVALSLCAIAIAVTYLFLVRAVLISAWAVAGAMGVTFCAGAAYFILRKEALPWEASLATFAFFAIVGLLTQYRFAGGAPPDDDGSDDDEPGRGKKVKPRLKPA